MKESRLGAWRSFLSGLVYTFNRNKISWVGVVILILLIAMALMAPVISPYNPVEQHIIDRLKPPTAKYWLGADEYGRDILSRIVWGSRISLSVGTIAVLLGMLIGGILGIFAGYRGGFWDNLIMRTMDVFMSIPTLLMGLFVVAALGPSLVNLTLAIAMTVAPRFARIARAPTVSIKERDYIEACRAMGFSDLRIMLVHILPNILGDLLVMGSLWIATAVRIEASLSFIGLGVPPPTPTWGGMVREGFEKILDSPWVSIYPGVFILMTVFAFNLLGDGLRDAIDPKLRDS
ncbi:MAG: ABC transporter permease [Deltaproteobacteria bacterium RBG_16_48_10]|nr:MAG: ABC transporter permease [Deltaproteobacteria bacterium RBG_16_48_10]